MADVININDKQVKKPSSEPKPNEELIQLIEDLRSSAASGEVVALMVVATMSDEAVKTAWVGGKDPRINHSDAVFLCRELEDFITEG